MRLVRHVVSNLNWKAEERRPLEDPATDARVILKLK
jgi:hypothetical protein